MNYPKPDESRCGCKVSFYYYKDEDLANQAVTLAQEEGKRMWSQGYDFGYRSPGEKSLIKAGPWAGMWEVVIP